MTFWSQAPSFANYRHKKYPPKGKEHPYKRLADYKHRVKTKAKKAKPSIHAKGEPREVNIYAVNQRADADNIRKGIKDAMEGVFYENDKMIGGSEWPIKDKSQKAHVTVEVVW
jgi:Holliday junction resolvase RusA-like endonuclease